MAQRKRLASVMMLAVLMLSACAEPGGQNSEVLSDPAQSSEAPGSDTPSHAPEGTEREVIPPEGAKEAEIAVGESRLKMYLPAEWPAEEWKAEENRLVDADGQTAAEFESVTAFESGYSDMYFSGLDKILTGAVHSGECTAPGLTGKYYHFQTVEPSGVPGIFINEFRYFIFVDGHIVTVSFYPMMGRGGISLQSDAFERCLATLVITEPS